MCGIIGQFNTSAPIDPLLFKKMRDTLSHRGPDGAGMEILEEGLGALGHRRLSIIDLSKDGHQPMSNEDQSIWLTFNGEIYNFLPLRETLLNKGHRFRSKTDSEVLIHGYEEWGIEGLLQRIKGMYALGIWDSNKKQLLLARDRLGIKPLYYVHSPDGITFASELKAIVKNPLVKRELDLSSIADFLVYRFIPSPKTIYSQAKKLPPASYLVYSLDDNSQKVHTYWELSYGTKTVSEKELKEQVEELLLTAIKEHLISDVPVGVFLSGGYDSSAIVHFMHKLSYPITSFSIGFENWQKSEHNDAKRIAKLYDTQHYDQILSESLIEKANETAYYYDEPLGGSSFLPTFAVSKLAHQHVKVVLGGDGGDEVFAGYKWHYRIMDLYANPYRRAKQRLKAIIAGSQYPLLQHYFDQMSWGRYSYQEVENLIPAYAKQKNHQDDLWLYLNYKAEVSPLKQLQILDLKTFLPELILPKVDRASMAHSIEVRVPFLDHELIEFMMGLNYKSYYEPTVKKKALFNVLKAHLPESILNKPKQGFGAPTSPHKNMKHIIDYVQNGQLLKDGICSEKVISTYVQDSNFIKLWPLYILESWYRAWIATPHLTTF